jgi:hypothetical protein
MNTAKGKRPFTKIKTNRNTWTTAIESVARDIGNKSLGYKWMHVQSAEKIEWYYDRLSYINIAFTPLIALGVLYPSTTEIPEIKIGLGVLVVLNGIVVSLLKFWGNIQESQAHRYTSTRYSSLVSNIRRHLSIDYQDRQEGKTYIEWIAREYDQLLAISQPIDSKCAANYIHMAKKYNIPFPDLEGLTAIQILNINSHVAITIKDSPSNTDNSTFISDDNDDFMECSIQPPLDMRPTAGIFFKSLEKYERDHIEYELQRLNENAPQTHTTPLTRKTSIVKGSYITETSEGKSDCVSSDGEGYPSHKLVTLDDKYKNPLDDPIS